MAKVPARGQQLITLPVEPLDLEQIQFNMEKHDQFVRGHGVTFLHFRAMPSPVGLKDRGEYRRSDALDTISSNGMIYKQCGCFTAPLLSNSKKHNSVEGGMVDQSVARITLPRYYDKGNDQDPDKAIRLVPGDRLYVKDLDIDVVTYQRVDYNPEGVDLLQYPALYVEAIIDSRMIEYIQDVDFIITSYGNIKWIDGKKNPGIDPDTGKGRVYSIRYGYNAHWYIQSIPNEVRIMNKTENGIREPQRGTYHAMIVREYVYHNTLNKEDEQTKKDKNPRHNIEPTESIPVEKPEVQVNIAKFKIKG
jgi:hypothetical protein